MQEENQDQVESPVEETKVEETVEISEAEQLDQVKALMTKDESEEVQEEVQEETQTESKETKEEIQSEPIVTDEMIEQFPTLKMYRGKPLKDMLGVYNQLVRKFTQERQLNKELQGKLSKTSLNELGSPPDSVEHPEEFKAWLKKRDELLKEQILSETSQAEPQVDYVAEVQKRLPKDVDVKKVMDGWSRFNAERLFDYDGNLKPAMQTFYNENPNLLISEVVNFYNLYSRAEQNDTAIEKKSKEEAFKQTKQAFKKARETQKESSQVNVIQRNQETSEEQELLNTIYQNLSATG